MDRFITKKRKGDADATATKCDNDLSVSTPASQGSTAKSFSEFNVNSVNYNENDIVIVESNTGCESLISAFESSSSTCGSTSEVKQMKFYKHKFKETWKNQFKWVEKQSGTETEALCKVCRVRITGSVTHLRRHELTHSHLKNVKVAMCTPSVRKMFQVPVEKTVDDHVKEGELKLTMFLAEHNLPFRLMDHLPHMVSSVCPDSKIAKKLKQHIKRKKATQLTTSVLGPSNKEDLINDLKQNYFSLIIDETTDVSTSKCLAIIVRYYKSFLVVDRFFDMVEVQSCTAKDIFSAIKVSLETAEIPVKNVIGLGADNCAVMMGNINGVKALFQQVNPNIVTMGCSCHSFHLCSSYACEKLPKSIEQFTRDIYNYFSNSSKRCIELRDCEIFANEKPQTMLRPSQTRWLSLQNVVNRILEHWSSLELFFTRAALEDNVQSAHSILNALKSPIYKVYLHFLAYILEIINKLNLEFQSECPKIHLLLRRIQSLYALILQSFIKKDYVTSTNLNDVIVSNPTNYLPLEQIYCGAKVEVVIKANNISDTEIKNFKIRVLDFYIELAKQIKQRFNFNDLVLKFASNFDPNIVISGETSSISDAEILFPYLDLDIEELDLEYRLISVTEEIKKFKDCDIVEFWCNVGSLRNSFNEKLFPSLLKLIKVILALPHSSAAAERIFSQLNLIKNKTRNRLLTKTCAAVLHCKDMLRVEKKKCFEWVPTPKMLKYSNAFVESQNVSSEDIVFE